MTTRKLTPAEALECLRDWWELCPSDFNTKWGRGGGSVACSIGVLQSLLSEHEETKAKLANLEALAHKPPAAQVPSDEVIAGYIEGSFGSASYDDVPLAAEFAQLRAAVLNIARRIGVQGVPQ